ncbi:MAG TPA: cupin domain-containing protein [Anaeromyxobacteraceae bacterium]|nr:cupin domain-containing protein [Anaeromyxobacteraceae bacterium]
MTMKKSASTMVAILAGALTALGAVADDKKAGHDEAAGSAHMALTPKELVWGDAPPALPRGAKLAVIQGDPAAAGEVVTVRLKMPKGYTIPPHFHPTDEAVTVLSGSLSMGTGDALDRKAAKALGPGGWCLIPKGAHHYAFATADTVVQVHLVGPFGITYVNPEDDPQARATR